MPKLFMRDMPHDGGAACIATILHHFGLYITPIDLAQGEVFSRTGVTADQILANAGRFGLQGRLETVPCNQIHLTAAPFLAFMAGEDEDAPDQVVVVFGVQGEKVFIGDTDQGKYTTTKTEFAKKYRQRLITFATTSAFKAGVRSRSYLARFAAFISAWRRKILFNLSLGLVASGSGFALIYLGKYFVDSVLPPAIVGPIITFLLVYFLARLLNIVAGGFNLLHTVSLRNAVTQHLGAVFYRQLLHLEMGHIESREEGDFIDMFTRIETLTRGVAEYFSNFLLALLGISVKLTLLILLYDPLLVAILCGVLVLNALVGLLFSRKTAELANRQSFVSGMINSALLDSLADIRVLRIFGARQWIADRFRKLYGESLQLLHHLTRLEIWGQSLADVLNTLSEATIFIVCGIRIMEGSYSVGDFLVFFTFAQGLAAESRQFPQLLLSFPVQLRSFARVQALLQLSKERSGGNQPVAGSMEIVFDNVCFGYEKSLPVLNQVSFTLERGRTTAFVGASGSGKSTIMNLIMGFYAPDSGRVIINGQDLATLDLEAHRKAISCVFQDTSLLSKTLYNNLAMGNEKLELAEIKSIAAALGIDRLIDKLPMGYELLVYQGMLSGGETQMVGILRALCKPFELLIMDEATSHLDSESEARILEGMHNLGIHRKTRAIIAHRLNTVRSADRIIVMANGEVAEVGTHEDLVRKKGSYMDLVQRQYEVNLTPGE